MGLLHLPHFPENNAFPFVQTIFNTSYILILTKDKGCGGALWLSPPMCRVCHWFTGWRCLPDTSPVFQNSLRSREKQVARTFFAPCSLDRKLMLAASFHRSICREPSGLPCACAPSPYLGVPAQVHALFCAFHCAIEP